MNNINSKYYNNMKSVNYNGCNKLPIAATIATVNKKYNDYVRTKRYIGSNEFISMDATAPWDILQRETEMKQQSDGDRLESIKQQILTKLGLSHKPNITQTLPKQFIWDTIYRANGLESVQDFDLIKNHTQYKHVSRNLAAVNNVSSFNYRSRQWKKYHLLKYIQINNKYANLKNYNNEINNYHINLQQNEKNKEKGNGDYGQDREEDFFGSTQEIISFAERGTKNQQHNGLLEFAKPKQKATSANQRLFIRYAELHLRVDRIQSIISTKATTAAKTIGKYQKHQRRIKIWIFQLIENSTTTTKNKHNFMEFARFCASFELNSTLMGWQKFDLTQTVKDWYSSSLTNEKLRLIIDCSGCANEYKLQIFKYNNKNKSNTGNNKCKKISQQSCTGAEIKTHNGNILERKEHEPFNANRPFLVMHTETKRLSRVRRRVVDCSGALNGQCCKESFYVSFKALGWDDWIIAPRGYFANYCRGDCSARYRTPDTFQTFHAHFIEEYRKMGLLNGMNPCCAPVKFSSMSLIYYGDDGIIKRDLPKMVVDECGCP